MKKFWHITFHPFHQLANDSVTFIQFLLIYFYYSPVMYIEYRLSVTYTLTEDIR